MIDIIDMESYKSGYEAGKCDGYSDGYIDCKRELKKRVLKKKEEKRRDLYFLRQKMFGLMLVIVSIITSAIFQWDLSPFVFITPFGVYFIVSKNMWYVDSYFLEQQEREMN